MDKATRNELLADGVKPEHIGQGAATVNDLEAAGVGPNDVSDTTKTEIFNEVQAQGTEDEINDDSGVEY